jgi:hypothetical protein
MSAAWKLAVVLPDEPASFVAAVQCAATLGVSHVEVPALVDRPAEHLAALADTGLFVTCVSLGCGLGAEDVLARRRNLEQNKRQVADAARLGATLAYLTPSLGLGDDVLACFSEGSELLAGFSAGRMVRLLVLPVAGTCLPGVEETLAWLEGRPGIDLALSEPSAAEVRRAGHRLAYVQCGAALRVDVEQALHEAGFRGVVAVRSQNFPCRATGGKGSISQ